MTFIFSSARWAAGCPPFPGPWGPGVPPPQAGPAGDTKIPKCHDRGRILADLGANDDGSATQRRRSFSINSKIIHCEWACERGTALLLAGGREAVANAKKRTTNETARSRRDGGTFSPSGEGREASPPRGGWFGGAKKGTAGPGRRGDRRGPGFGRCGNKGASVSLERGRRIGPKSASPASHLSPLCHCSLGIQQSCAFVRGEGEREQLTRHA